MDTSPELYLAKLMSDAIVAIVLFVAGAEPNGLSLMHKITGRIFFLRATYQGGPIRRSQRPLHARHLRRILGGPAHVAAQLLWLLFFPDRCVFFGHILVPFFLFENSSNLNFFKFGTVQI
jgi:hypothetical protein